MKYVLAVLLPPVGVLASGHRSATFHFVVNLFLLAAYPVAVLHALWVTSDAPKAEASWRCSACVASVTAAMAYCPGCGRPLAVPSTPTHSWPDIPKVIAAVGVLLLLSVLGGNSRDIIDAVTAAPPTAWPCHAYAPAPTVAPTPAPESTPVPAVGLWEPVGAQKSGRDRLLDVTLIGVSDFACPAKEEKAKIVSFTFRVTNGSKKVAYNGYYLLAKVGEWGSSGSDGCQQSGARQSNTLDPVIYPDVTRDVIVYVKVPEQFDVAGQTLTLTANASGSNAWPPVKWLVRSPGASASALPLDTALPASLSPAPTTGPALEWRPTNAQASGPQEQFAIRLDAVSDFACPAKEEKAKFVSFTFTATNVSATAARIRYHAIASVGEWRTDIGEGCSGKGVYSRDNSFASSIDPGQSSTTTMYVKVPEKFTVRGEAVTLTNNSSGTDGWPKVSWDIY